MQGNMGPYQQSVSEQEWGPYGDSHCRLSKADTSAETLSKVTTDTLRPKHNYNVAPNVEWTYDAPSATISSPSVVYKLTAAQCNFNVILASSHKSRRYYNINVKLKLKW